MNLFSSTQPVPSPPPPVRSSSSSNVTFPHGFIDFLNVSPGRRHHVGAHELQPARLQRFNRALRDLSPEAPALTLDQIATAGKRALQHHADGATPPFVQSRMRSLTRLQVLADDVSWEPSLELRRQVRILNAYRQEDADLIPDDLPVVGLLDDAVLVDVALQLLHDELGEYEDFCRFRKVAAEFAGMAESDTGLTRSHWQDALREARASLAKTEPKVHRYVPNPRDTLFHIG